MSNHPEQPSQSELPPPPPPPPNLPPPPEKNPFVGASGYKLHYQNKQLRKNPEPDLAAQQAEPTPEPKTKPKPYEAPPRAGNPWVTEREEQDQ